LLVLVKLIEKYIEIFIMDDRNQLVTYSNYQVTSADTDMFARAKLSFLLDLMIQGAIHSADSLGFGYDDLQQQQLFWVLNRVTMEIKRPLMWKEKVEVETWPKDVHKILYLRDFIVRDESGEQIAIATSAWLALDFKTKRPGRVEGIMRERLTKMRERHAIKDIPEKLIPVNEGKESVHKVAYFDIDLNKHLTSTRYVDWMMDSLPIEHHENNYPKIFSVNFLKETLPNETLMIISTNVDKEDHRFTGKNLDKDEIAVQGRIGF
jgi:medium-chain acyl-[acyl-carrier-protein] hydrolase